MIQSEFHDALTSLLLDPDSEADIQRIHIVMTGGPAPTAEEAQSAVAGFCAELVTLLS